VVCIDGRLADLPDFFCRISIHDNVIRNVLGYNTIRRHDAIGADVSANNRIVADPGSGADENVPPFGDDMDLTSAHDVFFKRYMSVASDAQIVRR
jgi:hypothetical protein